jgi:hypothetical protein
MLAGSEEKFLKIESLIIPHNSSRRLRHSLTLNPSPEGRGRHTLLPLGEGLGMRVHRSANICEALNTKVKP